MAYYINIIRGYMQLNHVRDRNTNVSERDDQAEHRIYSREVTTPRSDIAEEIVSYLFYVVLVGDDGYSYSLITIVDIMVL